MKVQELLATPDRWTKGANARDKMGQVCTVHDGVSFCLYGAVQFCYPVSKVYQIAERIEQHLVIGLVTYNDAPETTYKDIVNLIKELDL